jgi:hypothetical protein
MPRDAETRLLEENRIRTEVLHASVEPEKREAWIASRVRDWNDFAMAI